MIYQRLKNLWKLSAIELFPNGMYPVQPDFTVSPMNNTVQIIKKQSEIDQFLKANFKQ